MFRPYRRRVLTARYENTISSALLDEAWGTESGKGGKKRGEPKPDYGEM
jgi:hypothetical protein